MHGVMKLISIIAFCGCLFGAIGCLPDASGEPPPGDKLIYPIGLKVTHNGQYLLVANSNFDLRYNAGTLIAIDIDKLKAIWATGGNPDWLSRDGQTMFVPAEELVDAEDTIRFGAYASDLELTPQGDKAIIPVRGEKAIVIVDVNADAKSENGRLLDCNQGKNKRCDKDHMVTSNSRVSLPIEPYEVTSATYRVSRDVENEDTITYGFATHLSGGEVSAFRIDGNPELIKVTGSIIPSASGISVRQDPDSLNNEIYVAGRNNPNEFIAVMKLIRPVIDDGGFFTTDPEEMYFSKVSSISFSRDIRGGTDARGIAVSNTGNRDIVLVTRTPEALLRFNRDQSKLSDITTLGSEPSVVEISPYKEDIHAFVLCFLSNQVYIVEPNIMQVYVRSTGSGPHAIAFDQPCPQQDTDEEVESVDLGIGADKELEIRPCDGETRKPWAYIANFHESTITIIEAVPPFDQVRLKDSDIKLVIGKPNLPD
jgi:hypothetical protein